MSNEKPVTKTAPKADEADIANVAAERGHEVITQGFEIVDNTDAPAVVERRPDEVERELGNGMVVVDYL